MVLNMVKPVFDAADADLSVIVTTHPGYAKELAAGLKLDDYDGFLVLGGDGTFHEVVNGMFERCDGITMPIGLIQGGSGNSLLRDLDLTDPMFAAEVIVSQHTRFMDVARIEMNQNVMYSVNLIGWGLVTDVGRRAEMIRWLGVLAVIRF